MNIPGYRIERLIGQGGMATAYLAVQESLGRRAVLKILKTSEHEQKGSVERFRNEARIIASLNHPHIITIYDIGVANGFSYISMEYIEGGDLRPRIKQGLPAHEGLDIIKKVGDGLAAAHKKGIVHRDVKPGNILFRKDGEPLLTDFGIAKQLTVDHDLTSTGMFLGSPGYIAPEQSTDAHVDGRADIYSLGIIFYEMLAGTKPYHADSVIELILQHKQAPIPKLPSHNAQYQVLLNLMLAKDRKDRFRDAESLIHYIHNLEKTEPASLFAQPDYGAAHEITTPRGEMQVTQTLATQQVESSGRMTYVLLVLLVLSLIGNGVLYYFDYALNKPLVSATKDASEFFPIPLASRPSKGIKANPNPDKVTQQEVTDALEWLGRSSLEEYRLMSPPKDNAFYYFSRLLEIEPNSQAARRGLLRIAERLAVLAERAIASNDYRKAQEYIDRGLKIDPKNNDLITLQSLVRSDNKNFIDRAIGFFRGG